MKTYVEIETMETIVMVALIDWFSAQALKAA